MHGNIFEGKMITGKQELEALKLDEIFKYNLALIRPHILYIKSITDANLCRLWLERLNASSVQEKAIRNTYISELRCQVEIGKLKPPFDSPPSNGELVPLILMPENDHEECTNSSWSDITETAVCHSYKDSAEDSITTEDNLSIMSVAENRHAQLLQIQRQYEDRMAADQALINRYKQALSFFLSTQNPDEEAVNRVSQVQNMYEKKITSLKDQIKELKNENKKLQQDVKILKKGHTQTDPVKNDWNLFYEEIHDLKAKLADVHISKETLEGSHKEVVAQYQREMGEAIGHLCHRLNEAQYKNRNVEMTLQVAVEKLDKLCLQCRREGTVPTLEDSNCLEKRKERDDLHLKVTNLKALVDLKNEEVKHLEAALKTQCYKMQEEVNVIKDGLKQASENKDKKIQAKVTELQKIVDRHSRMKSKLLKHYKHKLCCLQKERHIEVKSLELQLHTQRAEIIASLSQDKQKELEIVVTQLEERYKDMLIDTEKKFLKRQEDDQMRIDRQEMELSALLSRKNIQETYLVK